MTSSEKKRLVKVIAITMACILAVVSAALFISFIGRGIPCFFNDITGLQCPSCGSTRAAIALLRLDFKRAFSLNAMFPLEFGYIFYLYALLCINYIKKGRPSFTSPSGLAWIDYSALVLFIGWGIVRNIFGW